MSDEELKIDRGTHSLEGANIEAEVDIAPAAEEVAPSVEFEIPEGVYKYTDWYTQAGRHIPAPDETLRVYDQETIEAAIKNNRFRMTDAFWSATIAWQRLPDHQVSLAISLVVRSIKNGGLLYVPKELKDNPAFSGFRKGKKYGAYVAFYVQK